MLLLSISIASLLGATFVPTPCCGGRSSRGLPAPVALSASRLYDDEEAAASTLAWLDNFIIKHELCPFARPVRESTRVVVCAAGRAEASAHVAAEIRSLRETPPTQPATTLLVLPAIGGFAELVDFQTEMEERHESSRSPDSARIQLLAFHPDASFGDDEGEEDAAEWAGDPADWSMRSPMPMLHLLRDADVVAAEASWERRHAPAAPPGIQERNAAYLRGLGWERVAAEAESASRRPSSEQ